MAKVREMNESAWREWLSTRPQVIQALAERLPPDRLYKMKSTGHRVTLISYAEDETVTVAVTGQYNLVTFERQVFGVSPDDLEECDLPPESEPRGTFLDQDEAREYIASLKRAD